MGRLTKRPFSGKGLRVSQRRWIRNRLRNHGTVFVLVSRGSVVIVLSGAYAITTTRLTTITSLEKNAVALIKKKDPHFADKLYWILENPDEATGTENSTD